MRVIVLIMVLFTMNNLHAWGTHYLITRQIMQHDSVQDKVNEKVKAVEIETFIKDTKDKLPKVFDDYYAWLKQAEKKRFKPQTFNPDNPTLVEFLKAARLNPDTKFPLVNRLAPGEKISGKQIPGFKVSKWLAWDKKFQSFEIISGKNVTGASVLATFVDEPDWGLDHELWVYENYGYGEQPYGEPKGESSKAPFHMQFLNENFLVRTFAPKFLEGMVEERMELFGRLSKVAYENGHKYWAYRFAAWAMHYIQDMAQPYHSKTIPSAGFFYYLNYVFSFGIIGDSKKEIETKTTMLMKNRHFLYEDFVSVAMEEFYTKPNDLHDRLNSYLKTGPAFYNEPTFSGLLEEVADYSASHGSDLDDSIVETFGEQRTEDPKYDIEKDESYKMSQVIPTLDEEKANSILKETGADFQSTAKASRTVLRLCGIVR